MAYSVILSIDLTHITFLELNFPFTYLSQRFLNNILHLSINTFKNLLLSKWKDNLKLSFIIV